MYFDLAKKNIKSNLKDYILYFTTITLIVSIFFAFSSTDIVAYILSTIGGGEALLASGIKETMLGISIITMIGLAIIIIYSNSFFITRRKKDIGVCLSLGMSKSNIAKVLFLESLFVAVIALIIGIIGGVILAQLILFASLHIIGSSFESYKFIFSVNALIKTIIYFISVFIVVGIINISFVSKKISNTLSGEKRKSLLVQDSIISSIVILSVGIIGVITTFYLGMSFVFAQTLMIALVLGIISTILFMIGLVNIIIYISFKNTKSFLKGINIFSVCQLKSNIGRIVITSVITSILLLISMLAIALTINIQSDTYAMENMNPGIDAIVSPDIGISKLSQFNYIMDKSGASKNYDYVASMRLFFNGDLKIKGSAGVESYKQFNIATLTWYNQYMKMIGKPEVKLNSNEAMIIANSKGQLKLFESAGKNQKFELAGNSYNVKDENVVKNYQGNYYMPLNTPTLILPVKVDVGIESHKLKTTVTQNNKVLDFKGNECIGYAPTLALNAKTPEYNTVKAYNDLWKSFDNLIKTKDAQMALWGKTEQINSKIFVVDSRIGDRKEVEQNIIIGSFTGVYIGVIFLIGSVALIGLQVLIETSEEKERYNTLKNIGVNNKEINKNLVKQIIIRFAIPFIFVAISFTMICVLIGFKGMFGADYKILPITIIVTLIVYILYGIMTYMMAKKFINK